MGRPPIATPLPPLLLEVLEELRGPLLALTAAGLPDAWLGAGAIRNRVWNRVLGWGGPPDTDWDVAYAGAFEGPEAALAAGLEGPWEAVDQRAYGHGSAAEGIASWPETATAIGARWRDGRFEVLAPYGWRDLLGGVLRRAPGFADERAFRARVSAKRWRQRWPALREAEPLPMAPTLRVFAAAGPAHAEPQ